VYQEKKKDYGLPPTSIHDFLTGTPTRLDWQNLSKVTNELLEKIFISNEAFLAIQKEGEFGDTDAIKYKNTRRSRYSFFNYQINWPEIHENLATDYDVLCEVNDEQVFHHATFVASYEGVDPIRCWSEMNAAVNDRVKINSAEGVITSIVHHEDVTGNYSYFINWDTSPPDFVQGWDRLQIRSPYEHIDINVRPSEGAGEYGAAFSNYNILIDLVKFNIAQGDTYVFNFTTDQYTPSNRDTDDGDLIVGFIGESVNIVSGAPEPGWLQMAEWTHLDVVPGEGNQAINNIVQNIRNLQELSIFQSSITRLRDNVSNHFDLCLNHKYRWLGIIVEEDDDGELPEPVLWYHDGADWVEESLTYDQENLGEFEYIDLTQYPKLTEGTFYTLKNVNYAYELDFVAEL